MVSKDFGYDFALFPSHDPKDGRVQPYDSGITAYNNKLQLISSSAGDSMNGVFKIASDTVVTAQSHNQSPWRPKIFRAKFTPGSPSTAMTADGVLDDGTGTGNQFITAFEHMGDGYFLGGIIDDEPATRELQLCVYDANTSTITNETKANNSGNNVTFITASGSNVAQIVKDPSADNRAVVLYSDTSTGSSNAWKVVSVRKDTHATSTITVNDYTQLSLDTITLDSGGTSDVITEGTNRS